MDAPPSHDPDDRQLQVRAHNAWLAGSPAVNVRSHNGVVLASASANAVDPVTGGRRPTDQPVRVCPAGTSCTASTG